MDDKKNVDNTSADMYIVNKDQLSVIFAAINAKAREKRDGEIRIVLSRGRVVKLQVTDSRVF